MTQTNTVEELEATGSCYFMLHKPASNGFIEKVGYTVDLTTEEVVDYILLYQTANPGTVIGYKHLPYNGVAVFVGKEHTTRESWETILGVPLVKLPSAK